VIVSNEISEGNTILGLLQRLRVAEIIALLTLAHEREIGDFGFNTAENGVHTHDLNATVLNLLGLDHERLTFRYQGRDFRLTDVHGELVPGILA
jgi:hypothetical protein